MPLLETQTGVSPYVYTSSLVEVFSIEIDHFHSSERRGALYGTIEAVDDKGAIKLYDRDRLHTESIRAHRPISLSGPPRSIYNGMGFALNLDLRLRGDGDCADDDFVVCKWQFSWDVLKPEEALISRGKFLSDFIGCPAEYCPVVSHKRVPASYDRSLSATFEDRNTCYFVTMKYAIIQHAVQAWVEVDIVDVTLDVSDVEYDVRGTLLASYESLSGELELDPTEKDGCKVTLLNTGELECVKAKRWKNIQLSRCIVAVPAHTNLIIEADLHHGSTIIAKGKKEFKPFDHGVGVDYFKGDNIALRVKVEWFHTSMLPGESFYSFICFGLYMIQYVGDVSCFWDLVFGPVVYV